MQAPRTLAKFAVVLAAAGLLPLRSQAGDDRQWTTSGVHQGILTSAAAQDGPIAWDATSVRTTRQHLAGNRK
jgi:hypothetical protein